MPGELLREKLYEYAHFLGILAHSSHAETLQRQRSEGWKTSPVQRLHPVCTIHASSARQEVHGMMVLNGGPGATGRAA
jgi:hypothetical protein